MLLDLNKGVHRVVVAAGHDRQDSWWSAGIALHSAGFAGSATADVSYPSEA